MFCKHTKYVFWCIPLTYVDLDRVDQTELIEVGENWEKRP